MKCFITRRCKRLMWWAVLVHVDEIFLLQQICSVRMRVCLFFIQLCVSAGRWKLLIAPVILFWPDPAAINHFRLWNGVGYDPLTASQCPAVLLSSVKKKGRAVSKAWNSFLPSSTEKSQKLLQVVPHLTIPLLLHDSYFGLTFRTDFINSSLSRLLCPPASS